MRVLVVGSGQMGSSILRGLASAECRRRDVVPAALVRPSSLNDATQKARWDELRSLGIEFVQGDASADQPTLIAAMKAFILSSPPSVE